jgi:hypothetical protein
MGAISTLVLVATTQSTVPDVSPFASGITLALAVAAGLAVGWVWQTTAPSHISAAAPTMELRDEPPAVVDLLVGGFEVEDDAVPATAVDLAARGWFTIEEIGGDRVILRLRERTPQGDELNPFEQRVMRHISKHATNGIVPAPALTLGPDGVSERWFKGFVREVTRVGRAAGLCRRRWDLKHLVAVWAFAGLAIVPAVLLAVGANRTTDPAGWGSIGNLLLGLSFVVGISTVWLAQKISRSDAQVDTAAGRDAAAHWLGVRDFFRGNGRFDDKPAASVAIWERYLAYATAMGLAPLVQRQIPFETEHDRNAWSQASGHWRRVKIRYQAWRPSGGQHPGRVAFEGLIQAAVTGLIAVGGFYVAGADTDLDTLTAQQRQWIGLAGLVVAVLASAACLFALLRVILGVSDLFARRTIDGEVVRRRQFQSWHRLPKIMQWIIFSGRDESGISRDQQRRRKYHLAVDPGNVDTITAYTVTESIYRKVPQGARVRLKVSPRLGYVSDVEILEPPRTSAADEGGSRHPLAEEAIDKTAATVSGAMGGVFEQISSMTDEDGVPMLDQVDEDGVTLRARMVEGQDQLDRLRADPRLASSPLFGKLLDSLDPDKGPPPTET